MSETVPIRNVDIVDRPGFVRLPHCADPRVDQLQADIMRLVGVKAGRPRREILTDIRGLLDAAAGMAPRPPAIQRATIPYLDEPWYC